MVGVIVDDIAALAEGVMIYFAPAIIVNKRVGTTCVFAAGDKVYYNAATNTVDIAATTTYVLCGRALEAAGASATTVLIELNGAVAA
jgi:predicted RecA/RadA family phage recombinase